MRLVSWNILHGGGERASAIVNQLASWEPDVVGLSEFRGTPPSRSIAAALADMGLVHQHATVDDSDPRRNRLLLASRNPFELHAPCVFPELGRWLHVSLDVPVRMSLVLMGVPNRKSGFKYEFHAATVNALRPMAGTLALAFGDTNTGVPTVDEETPFFNEREGQWFDDLANAGWIDLWRRRNPTQQQFTWHAPKGGAGFRIDQVFGTGLAQSHVLDVRYDWGLSPVGKRRGPSDHAAIIVDLGGWPD